MKEPRGNLYEKNNRYYVRIYYYVDGVRKSKDYATGIYVGTPGSRKGKQNERLANQKLAEILTTFEIPGEPKPEDKKCQMFPETIREWLVHQSIRLAPSTMAGYQAIARDVILYFGELHPTRTVDVTAGMIEQYQNWERMRRSPGYEGEHKTKRVYQDGSGVESTVKHRSTLIRSVLQYAKREGIIERNPASTRDAQIDLPNPQRHAFSVLSPSEGNRLLVEVRAEDLWFATAVTIGLLWGLRRSEIIGLRVTDIDWETGKVTIRHTITQQTINGKRTITPKTTVKNKRTKSFDKMKPITGMLKKLAEENRKNEALFGDRYDKAWDDYLFRYSDGKLVPPDALTKKFSQFMKNHNMKRIRFHDLRHSCASILFANGVDIKTIQKILGHAQLSTTMMYTHFIDDVMSSALNQLGAQLTNNIDMEEDE